MKQVKNDNKLWSESPSASEMLYGKELNKKIRDRYKKEQLNERRNV